MVSAQLINGRLIGKTIIEGLSAEVQRLGSFHRAFKPGLAVVQVGELQDSNLFIKMKLKAATEAGFLFRHITFPETCTEQEVHDFILILSYFYKLLACF